jgi:hypothetical protein
MNRITLSEQNRLLQNRERVLALLQQYPNVVNVGVGLKETGDALTAMICYRVYVEDKKPPAGLQPHEIIPPVIDGFITDVIDYGIIETTAMDSTHYRPLKGGIQIKQDIYGSKRGAGTLGCLAVLNDGSGKIVGLTNEHVLRTHSLEGADGNQVGQPHKVECCCCCTKNIIGKVLDSSEKPDCAIIELHNDIIHEIQAAHTVDEIHEIGKIKGRAVAKLNTAVKKRGAATRLTHGIIKDIAFDGDQILIGPADPDESFASFGDSGSLVLTEDNQVIGLLWGTKRDRFKSDTLGNPDAPSIDIEEPLERRMHGIVTPIAAVEEALNIKIYTPPAIKPTFSIHPDDTKTHIIPSIKPASENPLQHFVTAKGEGGIILKVTFDQPVDSDKIRWISDNASIHSPAIGNDHSTAVIPRNGTFGSRSEIRVMVDGFELDAKVLVWIVWSDTSETPDVTPVETRLALSTSVVSHFWREFEIQPSSLFHLNEDVPDLRGPNATPPPNVDATDGNVFNKGADLSHSARYKWDATAQVRCKVKKPDWITLPDEQEFKEFIDYPSSSIVGNAETDTVWDEDPYSDQVPAKKGYILNHTLVHRYMPHNIGFIHNTVEFKVQHLVFNRLELNGHWYNISDLLPVRSLITFEKVEESSYDVDINQDGDKIDLFWVKTHSFNDYNNDDF